MRHRKKGQKMGRTAPHRRATLANMAAALIKHEQIETTLPKARALRPFVEKLITLSKKGGLHERRLAVARLREEEGARKLFSVLGPRYKERQGGYTRIIKTGFRRGDDAPQSVIELVDRDEEAKGKDSGSSPEPQDSSSE